MEDASWIVEAEQGQWRLAAVPKGAESTAEARRSVLAARMSTAGFVMVRQLTKKTNLKKLRKTTYKNNPKKNLNFTDAFGNAAGRTPTGTAPGYSIE